jgi:hypothetical protein
MEDPGRSAQLLAADQIAVNPPEFRGVSFFW